MRDLIEALFFIFALVLIGAIISVTITLEVFTRTLAEIELTVSGNCTIERTK